MKEVHVLCFKSLTIVGQKGIRKFKKVILEKVKWNPKTGEDEEDKTEDKPESETAAQAESDKKAVAHKEALPKQKNKCILMWEVVVTLFLF